MKLASCLVCVSLAIPAMAQSDVQWTNPAGGSFFDPSNWAGGTVPNADQNARFALPGTYTVTGSQPWDVVRVFVPMGDVTLAVFGETGLRASEMHFGTVGGERTVVRAPAPAYRTISGSSSIIIRNGDFLAGGIQGYGLYVLNGSTATITGNVNDANRSVHVDADSLLRCEGISLFWANNLESSGRVEVVDSFLSLNALTQTGGSIHAVNSIISGEGVSAHGGVYTFIDSVLRSPCCARTLYMSGEVVFQGSQAAPDGLLWLQSGRVSLLQGATSAWNVQLSSSTLYVGPASAAVSVWAQGESVVRVSGQGTIGSSQASGNRLLIGQLGTVQFELDALALPTAAPVLARDAAGSLTITVQHPNALQLGQQVPLITRDLSDGVFSSVDLPTLHGGRALQLVYEPTLVSVRVVSDPSNPCWTADFDGDGDTGTDADIEAFFACLAGNCCPACAPADFDGDGSSGTDADIEAFFRVLAGAPC
jgi:hypothetical protein